MKKIVVVLVSLVIAVLVIGGNAFAHIPEPSLGPEWKLVFTGSDSGSTLYVNTRKITYLPGGIVKVRTLWVLRGEWRRKIVNGIKANLLLKGKDPNNAERLWYEIALLKFNCETQQYTPLEYIDYSFEKTVIFSYPFYHEEWDRVPPGSPAGAVEKYVCNEVPPSISAPYKASIPEPSLSSEWKPAARGLHGTTLYVNTRSITHLPKGIVKVWTIYVLRGEGRRTTVNELKKILLSEGKDPKDAERFGYTKILYKINCKTHQDATPKFIVYSFGKRVLYSHSFQHEKWNNITPGSIREVIEKYVCNEAHPLIPEPSLSSEWKVAVIGSGWSTIYVDTRRITYLPKGIVKVWVLGVPRGEFRRGIVNGLKKILFSEGKDPNNAERLWYQIQLDKVNCKVHKIATLKDVFYSFEGAVLDDESYQHKEWENIIPGTIYERVEKYVCKSTGGEK